MQQERFAMVRGHWEQTFLSRKDWNYVLEATTSFHAWSETSAMQEGTGGLLILRDLNIASTSALKFYRIKATPANL
jgi:hypothetical protein